MSALSDFVDLNARDQVAGVLMDEATKLLSRHGAAAFVMPRHLAVHHETGHAIIGAADGVAVKRVEVFSRTVLQMFKAEQGRNLRRIERQRLIAAGYSLTAKHWGGLSTWGDSPFASDAAGSVTDMEKAELKEVEHAVRMRLGGICGEHVINAGKVPEGSSLDEVVTAQMICFAHTGSHDKARDLFNRLWLQTSTIIADNETTGRALIAAFDRANTVEGEALQAVLKGVGKNEVRTGSPAADAAA